MSEIKKKLRKPNALDIVIILIVLAIGAFLVMRLGIFSPKKVIAPTNDKIRLVFMQEEVNSFTAENVKIGDPTGETLRNQSLGKVTDIKIEPSISFGIDKLGNQITSTKEGFSSVYITLEGSGTIGPNGININGSSYYIGQLITLRVGTSIFYGSIYTAEEL